MRAARATAGAVSAALTHTQNKRRILCSTPGEKVTGPHTVPLSLRNPSAGFAFFISREQTAWRRANPIEPTALAFLARHRAQAPPDGTIPLASAPHCKIANANPSQVSHWRWPLRQRGLAHHANRTSIGRSWLISSAYGPTYRHLPYMPTQMCPEHTTQVKNPTVTITPVGSAFNAAFAADVNIEPTA